MPHLQAEGSVMIRNLLPYFRFLYGNEVEQFFTQECVDNNVGIVWDDVNKCVISTIETNQDFIGLGLVVKFVQNNKESANTQIYTLG